jgi:hypothetical protein
MRKKTLQKIDPEKMGFIAEHGVKKSNLTKQQWKWLGSDGFSDLKELQNLKSPQEYEPLPERLTNTALETFFPIRQDSEDEPLHIQCINGIMELLKVPDTWVSGSPAFSWRSTGCEERRVAFTHKEDPVTAHIELVSNSDSTTDISVICNDPSGQQFPKIDVELLRNGRCIESVSANENGPVTIRNISKGPLQLAIYYSQGNCITLNVRID